MFSSAYNLQNFSFVPLPIQGASNFAHGMKLQVPTQRRAMLQRAGTSSSSPTKPIDPWRDTQSVKSTSSVIFNLTARFRSRSVAPRFRASRKQSYSVAGDGSRTRSNFVTACVRSLQVFSFEHRLWRSLQIVGSLFWRDVIRMLSRAPDRDSSEGSPGGTAWKVRWRATTRRRFCLQRRNSPGKPEIGAFRRSNVRRRRPPIPETGIALLDRRPSYRPSAASLLPRRSRRLWQPPARGAVGRPRNPRESLPFDMAELIERSISDWYGAQPPGTPSPEVESVGGFIVAELNRRELRYFNGLAARFQDDPDSEAYRLCVMFALDFWRIAVS